MKDKIKIGDVNNDYVVIEHLKGYYKNGVSAYKIKCQKCGNEKITTADRFRKNIFVHDLIRCGDKYIKSDIIDNQFGEMFVLSFRRDDNDKEIYLNVKCVLCGNEREVVYSDFINKKCGRNHKNSCSRDYKIKIENEKFYNTWASMKKRCDNVNNDSYDNYGGRGIKCDYNDIIDFYKDMFDSYIEHCEKYGEDNTTLERIDVDGNYTKGNIKWATWEEQYSNRRNNNTFIAISSNGEKYISKNIKEFAREHNLNFSCIRQTLIGNNSHHKGWKFKYIDK